MNVHELTLKILFAQIASNGLVINCHSDYENNIDFEETLTENELKKYHNDDLSDEEIEDIREHRQREDWDEIMVQIKVMNYCDDDEMHDGYLHEFSFTKAYDFIRSKIVADDLDFLERLDKGHSTRKKPYF